MIATVGVTPTNWNEMLVHPVFNVGKGMPLEVDKPSPYPSHKSYRKYMEDLLLYPENLGAHQYHSVDEFVLRALQAIQEAPISNPCWDGLVTSFESLHSQMIVKKTDGKLVIWILSTMDETMRSAITEAMHCERHSLAVINGIKDQLRTVQGDLKTPLRDIAADKVIGFQADTDKGPNAILKEDYAVVKAFGQASAIKPKQGGGPKKAFPRGGPQVALGIRTRRQQWPTKVEARNVPGQWLMRVQQGLGIGGCWWREPHCQGVGKKEELAGRNLAAAAYLLVGARGLSAVDAEVTVVTQTRRKRSAGASIRGSQWVVRLCVWGSGCGVRDPTASTTVSTSYFNVTPEKAIRIVSLLPFGLVTDGTPVAMMVEEVLRAKENDTVDGVGKRARDLKDEGEQIPRVAINWPPKPGMAVVYPCRIKDAAKLTKSQEQKRLKATGVSLSGTEGKDDKTLGEVEKDKRRTEMVDLAKKVVTEGRGMRRVLKRGGSWGWKAFSLQENWGVSFIIDDTVDPKPPFGLLLGQPFIDLAGAKTVWTEVGNQWTRFPANKTGTSS
ncbi:hypothetical protein BC829DRAFT_422043 [Chytridium lagenaria]|nr:hypothetical protein BC829DRAFT_422043 [Chytridium lagenaria]